MLQIRGSFEIRKSVYASDNTMVHKIRNDLVLPWCGFGTRVGVAVRSGTFTPAACLLAHAGHRLDNAGDYGRICLDVSEKKTGSQKGTVCAGSWSFLSAERRPGGAALDGAVFATVHRVRHTFGRSDLLGSAPGIGNTAVYR